MTQTTSDRRGFLTAVLRALAALLLGGGGLWLLRRNRLVGCGDRGSACAACGERDRCAVAEVTK